MKKGLSVIISCILGCMTFASLHTACGGHNPLKKNDMNNTSLKTLVHRKGDRPKTTPTNPHMQLTQQPEDINFVKELMKWAYTFSGVQKEGSRISVPGAVAMCLHKEDSCQDCNAFMIGNEFAHFHPHPDYSMHIGLPEKDAEIIIEKGWGEWHPVIAKGWLSRNFIMLYSPRNKEELEASKFILGHSYAYAKGILKQK